jgi:hypothetical protein
MSTTTYNCRYNGLVVHWHPNATTCHLAWISGGVDIDDTTHLCTAADIIQGDSVTLGAVVSTARNNVAYSADMNVVPSFHFYADCSLS